ncbi:MAG: hypothetical protein WC890_05895 [Candidatus Margulisiibacteriota bacterium]
MAQNGIGRGVLEVADESEFEIRFSRETNKVRSFMAALAVFGIDEAGQQVRVIKAMKDERIDGEVVIEGGKRGRGLNQDYVDNCVAVSVIFQAAGFTEDALTEARGAFLNAIDDDVHSVSMQKVASQILRIAIREGLCQQLVCRAYTGEKRKMLEFNLSSPDTMSRIVLRDPEELEARCAELSRVVVAHGKVRVYPARAKEAQYALCVAYSDKLIGERAIYLMEQYSFPQEAFDADPFILTVKSPSVNKSYATSSFLKAVNRMIIKKQYARAMQLISQAEKQGLEEARNEVQQAFVAYKTAIPLLLQAAAENDFGIAIEHLLQSYELCLSSQGVGGLKVERALCAPLISLLRIQTGQRIYLHYQNEAKRLEAAVGELSCRIAKLTLEEKELYLEAEKTKAWVALANRFSETKCGAECFACFVLLLFPVENKFVVSDEMIARLNRYGQTIIDGCEVEGKIKRADLVGKKNFEDQRIVLIAAKLFVLNFFQVDFISYLGFSIDRGIDLLVRSKAAQKYKAAEAKRSKEGGTATVTSEIKAELPAFPIPTGEGETMLALPMEEDLTFTPTDVAETFANSSPIGQISEVVEKMLTASDPQDKAADTRPVINIVNIVAEILETCEDRRGGIGLRLRALQHATGRARFETARLADILLGYCFIDLGSWQTIFGNIEEILELLEKPKTDFVVIKPLIDRLEHRPEEINKRLLLAKGLMSEVRNISPASITAAERALAQLEILPIAAIILSSSPEGLSLLKEIDSTRLYFIEKRSFVEGFLVRRKGR